MGMLALPGSATAEVDYTVHVRLSQLLQPVEGPATQSLVVTLSKRLYYLKGGALRYSRTQITAGSKKARFRHYLLCDRHARTFYAETHPAAHPLDVLGFFARAWSPKPWHFFAGCPAVLTVSRTLLDDPKVAVDISDTTEALGIAVTGPPEWPPWYASMVKTYEQAFDAVMWRGVDGLEECVANIDTLDAMACLEATYSDWPHWEYIVAKYPLRELPQDWLRRIDQQYRVTGAWRQRLHSDWPAPPIPTGREY